MGSIDNNCVFTFLPFYFYLSLITDAFYCLSVGVVDVKPNLNKMTIHSS